MRHTQFYKITHNPNYHYFLISPKLIDNENVLKFVYSREGKTIEKLIHVNTIGPHLNFRRMYKWDEALLVNVPNGYVYYVDENVVFEAPEV